MDAALKSLLHFSGPEVTEGKKQTKTEYEEKETGKERLKTCI